MLSSIILSSAALFAPQECPFQSSLMNTGTTKTAYTTDAQDIVSVATSAGKFNTLLAAATAASLAPVLQGDGPITVFAPTAAAF